MTRIERFFFSTKTMTALLFIFACSMAVATFVENDYDTPTAKMLIYNAKWFEILMLWIIIIFVFNIKIYQLTKKEKWPILIFHIAFILIFLGGAITRYLAFEGQMPIKEGETSNEIISDLTYIKVNINDGVKSITYDQHPYTMSYFNEKNTRWPFKRNFRESYAFDKKTVKIKSLDYIPLVKDSIQKTTSGHKILTIITTGQSGRENNYIFNGEIKTIGGILFSFNNPVQGTVQLIEKGDSIMINPPLAGQYMSMQGQQAGVVTDTALLAQQSGTIKANELTSLGFRTLYTINNTNFIIPNPAFAGKIVYYSGDKSNMTDKDLLSMVKLEISSGNEKDTVIVQGGKGITAYSVKTNINRLEIAIGYGSKLIKTPFSLRCDDFKLDRYPGSNNASSYESRVTVIDDAKETPHHIYMNNVMDYSGYRFFQASYFPDESGTILSVNKDWWGTRITYTGYFFLFPGMFLTLFRKRTHIWKLNQRLKDIHRKVVVLIPVILMISFANAQNSVQERIDTSHAQKEVELFFKQGELGGKAISTNHADKFGHLLVQDFQGRIKPMDTHTLELLRKIYKKDKYELLSPVQWFLSMQLDPAYWFVQPMIYVGKKGGDELAKETGANADGYTTFANLMDTATGEFRLQNQYKASFSKRKAEQSNYDKELISVTERYNIFGNIIYGYFTKIIPVRNDPSHTWRSWVYSSENNPVALDSAAYAFIALYFNDVKQSLQTGNWENTNEILASISNFQKTWSKDIIPSDTKVNLEILYNHANIFLWLMVTYSLLGISMIILGFAEVLSSGSKINHAVRILTKVLLGIIVLALAVQVVGLGVRWYLSGHAPWSNGYEAIIFISSIGVLAGLLLYKNRNAFIPAAGALVAMIMMGFAHGGSMLDPQITPLEPVLKSYWLMVHVGIITSSYGFFGLSALISIISLILFCIKPTAKIQNSIQELTIVNEMAAEIGLFALTIGTFLGGIWANESWGRYWSWDPKETWAFISIIFYATILHFRMVPGLKGKWTFNVAGMWMIWTIIFTYFGVNYYLSGLHSYAAGDPMPIPIWIPVTAVMMLVLSVASYLSERKYYRKQ
ncbi:cytochrome c biogenesis protein CcsA [Agriterribacter sp.]|uniref:cytochrome c biogenesis protein CcsA n=1 Tax=Agriterribacter sp. TaxID=2821509 RepID=UPI002CB55702|nr:cytochrome c biogenesis protein CcsA [Agriterribacter sp.]HRO46988.1 cytochrome c biogenesis protein CcsA [Agriterribacter sp.]HRQ18461.1 cytochrome c biogenesis protein CcsA [Agriterribacter sp.]